MQAPDSSRVGPAGEAPSASPRIPSEAAAAAAPPPSPSSSVRQQPQQRPQESERSSSNNNPSTTKSTPSTPQSDTNRPQTRTITSTSSDTNSTQLELQAHLMQQQQQQADQTIKQFSDKSLKQLADYYLNLEPADIPDTGFVVSGIAGRFPNADNLNELWDNLKNGRDMVLGPDDKRWPLGELCSTAQRYNLISDRWGM
jgi:type IV secretory pathway VirB10-like protein